MASSPVEIELASFVRRFIDLNGETLDMVRHYMKTYEGKNKWDLVFPTDGGGWQSRRNWQRRGVAKACEEAGLGVEKVVRGERGFTPKYTPYDLRQFYASMLIDQRVNLKRVQTLMGHRDVQTTLNVYGHLIERIEARAEAPVSVLGSLRTAESFGVLWRPSPMPLRLLELNLHGVQGVAGSNWT